MATPPVARAETILGGYLVHSVYFPSEGDVASDPFSNKAALNKGHRLRSAWTRNNFSWHTYEEKRGVYGFGSRFLYARRFFEDHTYVDGYQDSVYIPVVRATSDWATKTRSLDVPSPPADLRSVANARGFSDSYFDFLYQACARLLKDHTNLIVIENEIDNVDFFDGRVSDYVRMLATAKKAIGKCNADLGASLQIADGGLSGYALNIVNIYSLFFHQGRKAQARELYRHLFGTSISEQELAQQLERSIDPNRPDANNGHAHRAYHFIFTYRGYQHVDLINFHHYQPVETLTFNITFLAQQARTYGHKPKIMTNEFGTRISASPSDPHEESATLIKKVTSLAAEKLQRVKGPHLYFSVPSVSGEHRGAIVDPSGRPVWPLYQSFELMLRQLNRGADPLIGYQDQSDVSTKEVHVFDYASGDRVVVAWSKRAGQVSDHRTFRDQTVVFDYAGRRLGAYRAGDRIAFGSQPTVWEAVSAVPRYPVHRRYAELRQQARGIQPTVRYRDQSDFTSKQVHVFDFANHARSVVVWGMRTDVEVSNRTFRDETQVYDRDLKPLGRYAAGAWIAFDQQMQLWQSDSPAPRGTTSTPQSAADIGARTEEGGGCSVGATPSGGWLLWLLALWLARPRRLASKLLRRRPSLSRARRPFFRSAGDQRPFWS